MRQIGPVSWTASEDSDQQRRRRPRARAVSSLREIEAIEADFNYYQDSLALLRARLYRRGVATNPRLEELQRRRDGAAQRLRTARAERRSAPRR